MLFSRPSSSILDSCTISGKEITTAWATASNDKVKYFINSTFNKNKLALLLNYLFLLLNIGTLKS